MTDNPAIYIQAALPLLVFVAVVGIGGAILATRAYKRRPIERRLRQVVAKRELPVTPEPSRRPLLKAMYSIGVSVAPKGPSKGLRDDLSKAGWYSRSAPYVFIGAKMVGFVLGLLLALLTVPAIPGLPTYYKMLLVMLVGMTGMILPNFYLVACKNRREHDVRSHLPDAIDLMEVCVSSGMGLDMAWRAVTDQIRRVSPVLADEMSLTDLEINLGGQRSNAMRHMAERTGAPELGWLVSAFVQSERFGTSLADTLRAFAGSLREARSQQAEEAAEKLAVKIVIPMILFIFPAIVIVAVGPAGIRIYENFLK